MHRSSMEQKAQALCGANASWVRAWRGARSVSRILLANSSRVSL